MISSAVVIPELEPEQLGPSSHKRRQSSISSDSSKRPRLETQNFENGARPANGGAISPPSRRRSGLGTGAVEEKKRGQRLFGALLGTLSQTSSKPAHRKRDEIEQRQRERIRKDTEEKEEEKRRKREELDNLRRVEQKAWEAESERIRHRNMRAMAGFLQTKTEPCLYFKPWQLLENEEVQIKRQVREVDERIKAELNEVDVDEGMNVDVDPDEGARNEPQGDSHIDEIEDQGNTAPNDEHDSPEQSRGTTDTNKEATDAGDLGGREIDAEHQTLEEDDKHKDDDHAGEELVEGQEDDVIY